MNDHRVFELRTYHAAPGKLAALHQRFREHTFAMFARHGMELVAFLSALDEPEAGSTVTYILGFPDREAADSAWDAFRADPDWIRAKAESEVDGTLVERLDSIFFAPTPESPLQ